MKLPALKKLAESLSEDPKMSGDPYASTGTPGKTANWSVSAKDLAANAQNPEFARSLGATQGANAEVTAIIRQVKSQIDPSLIANLSDQDVERLIGAISQHIKSAKLRVQNPLPGSTNKIKSYEPKTATPEEPTSAHGLK